MKSRDFCFWLQGLFELQPQLKELNEVQLAQIKQHLSLVFKHDINIPPHEPQKITGIKGGLMPSSLDSTMYC